VATARNFTQGNLQQTGNNLDVAVKGQGFFQVQMPDGTTGYTRDGSLQVDARASWSPTTATCAAARHHHPGQCAVDHHGADGTVVRSPSAGQAAAAAVGRSAGQSSSTRPAWSRRARTCLPKPRRRARRRPACPPAKRPGLHLQQGFLETSNVNVVEELVAMIQTQRAYELNSKAIQTSDQMLQKLGQL
jgi:flagellar basal-body rod protein FlgG